MKRTISLTVICITLLLLCINMLSVAQIVEIKDRHLVTVYNYQNLKIAEKYFGPDPVLEAQVGSNIILVRLEKNPNQVLLFDRRFRFLMSKSLNETQCKDKDLASANIIGEIIVHDNRILVYRTDGWMYVYDDRLNTISRYNQLSMEMSPDN